MAIVSRDVARTNMWRSRPGESRLTFNRLHQMNDQARIVDGEFNIGGRRSESELSLINEDGHMISISFHPELFTKPGLNAEHYQEAVRTSERPPVVIMHGRAGGGAISAVQMKNMSNLALKVLVQLEREKGYGNAVKLARMAMNEGKEEGKKAA